MDDVRNSAGTGRLIGAGALLPFQRGSLGQLASAGNDFSFFE